MITCASAQISGRWKVANKVYLSLLVIDFFFHPICIELRSEGLEINRTWVLPLGSSRFDVVTRCSWKIRW